MTSASHRDVERTRARPQTARAAREPGDPFHDERRRCHNRLLAQALLTAVFIGIAGLCATAVLGLRAADISRHISYGIFSTMVSLLAHSMMMFYLIGKGKAVKEAMAEGGHAAPGDPELRKYVGRIAAARRPVFSIATLAMGATMVTAIVGASVDTGVLPPMVHAMLVYGAIAFNLAAAAAELAALTESSRVVEEVNRLLGS